MTHDYSDIDNEIYEFMERHGQVESDSYENIDSVYGHNEYVEDEYYQEKNLLPNSYDPRRNNQEGWENSSIKQNADMKKLYNTRKRQSNIVWSCLSVLLSFFCIGGVVAAILTSCSSSIP